MTPPRITRMQREVLEFLVEYVDQHRQFPTYQRIADGFGLRSLSTVWEHLEGLEREGCISKAGPPNSQRVHELTERGIAAVRESVLTPILDRHLARRLDELLTLPGKRKYTPAQFAAAMGLATFRNGGAR